MAMGGIGTPNGFGASWPMRNMSQAPESNVVTWTPDAKRYETDWQQRWDAAGQNMVLSDPTQIAVGASGYNAAAAAPFKQQIFDQMTRQKLLDAGVSQSALTPEVLTDYQDKVGGANNFFAFQGSPYGTGFDMGGSYGEGVFPRGASHTVQTWEADDSGRKALLAEMQAMMPLFENQAVQQSAYNSMAGNNQLNAILGPNYADPTFGQVTNNPGLSQGTLDAIMGRPTQTTGTYDPTMTSSGVYGAPRR